MALLLVFALLAGACGGDGDGDEGGGGGGGGGGNGSTTTKPGDDAAAAGFNAPDYSGEPAEGGSIVFGVESELATLDPAGSLAQPSDVVTALAIYDQLITYDEEGELAESLATKWEVSDDLKTWTITVRTGVEFSDNTPFNALAVKAQFDRFKDPATNCTCAPQVEQVVSVEAPSDDTVVFVLDEPNAFWANTLAGSLGFIASPAATAQFGADYARNPVGTGPFVLTDYEQLTLEKNPNYWQKDEDGTQLPYLDKITIKPIPDARNRLAALQSGDVDMLQTADTGTIVDVIKDKKFKVQKVTGSSSTIVLFNTKKPPFDDVRIRRAFAYALDRGEMNRVQYKGSRREAYSPFPPDSPFYADVNPPANNIEKAKELVAEAKADGVPTSFEAVCIPTDEARRVLGLVQAQMKKVGLTQTNEFQDQGAYVNRIFSKQGDYQVGCFRSPQIAHADALYTGLYTDQSSNVTFYSNPKVDKALDAIRATVDTKEHIAQLKIVQQQLAKDVPTLATLYDLFGNMYTTEVSGVPAPEPWSLGAIKVATLYLKK